MTAGSSPLAIFAIGSAVIAAAILVAYLVFRPKLVGTTKIWLLLGLGVFPLLTAGAGNVAGFEATKSREFCAGCHVMTLHTNDSADLSSASLSSRHGRNKLFGDENCYACHANYGMYGTILTKMGGMRHMYYYYLGGYRAMSMPEAKAAIRIKEPFPNGNCMQCHSTRDTIWEAKRDHAAALEDVRASRISCASAGCHGLAHPYWPTADDGGAR